MPPLVTAAVTMEQLWASWLQQLVSASLIVYPSGRTAIGLASAELVQVQARSVCIIGGTKAEYMSADTTQLSSTQLDNF
jgi:hypothetical protein